MTEHDEQCALIEWRNWMCCKDPRIAELFAIPNGGVRPKRTAGRLKAEGMEASVPDLCLPVAASGYGALWIEMKTDAGRLTPGQQARIDRLNQYGQCAVVARGWLEAARQICAYLSLNAHDFGL